MKKTGLGTANPALSCVRSKTQKIFYSRIKPYDGSQTATKLIRNEVYRCQIVNKRQDTGWFLKTMTFGLHLDDECLTDFDIGEVVIAEGTSISRSDETSPVRQLDQRSGNAPTVRVCYAAA